MANVKKLQLLINEISDLKELSWRNPRTSDWINDVFWYLKSEFGEDSDYYVLFNDVVNGPVMIADESLEEVFQKRHVEGLDGYKITLESILEEISDIKAK